MCNFQYISSNFFNLFDTITKHRKKHFASIEFEEEQQEQKKNDKTFSMDLHYPHPLFWKFRTKLFVTSWSFWWFGYRECQFLLSENLNNIENSIYTQSIESRHCGEKTKKLFTISGIIRFYWMNT